MQNCNNTFFFLVFLIIYLFFKFPICPSNSWKAALFFFLEAWNYRDSWILSLCIRKVRTKTALLPPANRRSFYWLKSAYKCNGFHNWFDDRSEGNFVVTKIFFNFIFLIRESLSRGSFFFSPPVFEMAIDPRWCAVYRLVLDIRQQLQRLFLFSLSTVISENFYGRCNEPIEGMRSMGVITARLTFSRRDSRSHAHQISSDSTAVQSVGLAII